MWWTDPRAPLGLILAGALLSGCAGGSLKDAGGTGLTATEQYAPKVTETPETLALAPHPTGLSTNQRQALAAFVVRYREDAPGEITLRTPSGGRDAVTPARMTTQVLTALEDLGVSRARVRQVGYDPAAEPAPPVVLSYWRYEAETRDCASTWNNVAATGGNKPVANFGCTTTSNFAAMVADPRDLLRPAASDPADNARRQVVMTRYRNGEITSTVRDQQASGTVSQAVK